MYKKYLITLVSLAAILLVFILATNINKPENSGASATTSNSQTTDKIEGISTSTGSTNVNSVPISASLTCPEKFVVATMVDGYGASYKICEPAPYSGDGDSQQYMISGYYSPYERQIYKDYVIDNEHLATTTCSAFTVKAGDYEFIEGYKGLIRNGNTVNRIDNNGDLVLNINIDILGDNLKNMITQSTSTSTLNLAVKPILFEGREADYCESFISIVSDK